MSEYIGMYNEQIVNANTVTADYATVGNLSVTNLTIKKVIVTINAQLSYLSTGILKSDVSGNVTSGAVDLSSADVTGILPNSDTTATPNNVANTIVERDSYGNFQANDISASTIYADVIMPNFTSTVNVNNVLITNNVVTANTFIGTLSGTSTTANNIVIANTNDNASYYLTISKQATSSSTPLYTSSNIVVNPNLNQIGNGYTIFEGTANYATNSGNATYITLTNDNTNTTEYLCFSHNATGTGNSILTNSSIGVNPYTSTIYATNFNGNASTSTNSNNSSYVTTYNSVANSSNYILFSNFSSSTGSPVDTNSQLLCNPYLGTMTANTFNGALSGNASSATYASSGAIVSTSSSSSFYPIFASATSGNCAFDVNSSFSYQPSTGTITCTNINANPYITTTSSNSSFYLIGVGNYSTGNQALYIGLRYNPSTDTIGRGVGYTSLSGTSTTASNITLANNTTNATQYICFASTATGSTVPIYTNTSITVNPSTNTIGNASTTFSGNATTATSATTATTATNANNINLNNNTSNATEYLLFSSSATGNQAVNTNSAIVVNPSTNTIGNASTTFSGNATTATTATTATNANNIYINYSNTSSTYYPTFTNGYLNDAPLNTNNNLSYVPLSGTLYATTLSGQYSVTSTTTNISYYFPMYTGNSTSNYLAYIGSGLSFNPSTNILTTTTFSGALSGNATTATSATTATNSNNVNLNNNTSNATEYLLFSSSATGNQAINTNSGLTCNPSTGLITATTFSGALSGNATSATSATSATNSTNSTNVNLTNNTTNATQYIPFSTTATGNQPLNTNTALSYNPSTHALSNNSVAVDTPIGSIIMYISATAPNTNWHLCDGSAISRTTYSALYAIIGTAYGSGDGSTTFNIPNFQSKFPYGYQSSSNPIATTGGASSVTLTTSNMPAHTHTVGGVSVSSNSNTVYSGPTTGYLQGSSSAHSVGIGAQSCSVSGATDSNGSGTSFNILPPYLTVSMMIKIL